MKNNAWNRMADLVFVSLACAAIAAGQDLTPSEREKAHRYLAETRNAVTTAVNGLSEAQWKFKAGPDRWSIAEVLEHITVTEEFFLTNVRFQIMRAPEVSPASDAAAVDAQLTSMVGDRSVKVEAPPMLRPEARWTPSAALEHFLVARMQTAQFLELSPDLRRHRAMFLPVQKEIDGYQWVLAVAGHSARHTKQILEVKADPNFPKN